MLPAFLTSTKKLAFAGLTASMLTTASAAPALAWGDNEQKFLAGVATTLALQYILKPSMFGAGHGRQPAPVYVPPPQAPVYFTPAPSYQPTSIYQTPAASAFNSYSGNERLRIQSALASYGYYHGSIDGAFGPGTYSAVTAYASNTGKSGMLSTQAGAYTLYDGLLF